LSKRHRLEMPKIVADKKEWIKLGYNLFSESGENGIVVDKMSRKLKCNKSSFYWHFKSKNNFIESILKHWIQSETAEIIQKVNTLEQPKKKLLKLIEIAFHKDSNLDFIFFLKRYAKTNLEIRNKIDQIDNDRIAFVSELLKEIGHNKKEANLKANIFYKYLIGYHEMIRYKKQRSDYIQEVLKEMNQFIALKK